MSQHRLCPVADGAGAVPGVGSRRIRNLRGADRHCHRLVACVFSPLALRAIASLLARASRQGQCSSAPFESNALRRPSNRTARRSCSTTSPATSRSRSPRPAMTRGVSPETRSRSGSRHGSPPRISPCFVPCSNPSSVPPCSKPGAGTVFATEGASCGRLSVPSVMSSKS